MKRISFLSMYVGFCESPPCSVLVSGFICGAEESSVLPEVQNWDYGDYPSVLLLRWFWCYCYSCDFACYSMISMTVVGCYWSVAEFDF